MKSKNWKLEVEEKDAGTRIDVCLSRYGDLSRNALQRLIITDKVTVNGTVARKNHRVSAGETIEVLLPEPSEPEARPENIPLDILFEDRDILVLNKPRGLVVHPSPGHEEGTLVNALLYHCGDSLSGIGGVMRPGIVHRLDKDTSGLMVCAKNDLAHTVLSAALKTHDVSRVYECIVHGCPKTDSFTISAPLGRHPSERKKQAVLQHGGRDAVTHVDVLSRYNGWSHLRCVLETGRTHQIRVHLAHCGHPVAGDKLYGGGKDPLRLDGQCLHARELSFAHPRTGESISIKTELPAYFQEAVLRLK